MIAYAYQAALYCEDCAAAIKRQLRADGKKPSEDSNDWPIGAPNGGGEADSPQHCDCGEDCLNAIVLSEQLIGAWLENELTSQGAAYVREAVEAGGEVANLWEQWYADYL